MEPPTEFLPTAKPLPPGLYKSKRVRVMQRYFGDIALPPLPGITFKEAYSELLLSLEYVLTHYCPVINHGRHPKFSGVYYGPASISLLFFSLSTLYPDVKSIQGRGILPLRSRKRTPHDFGAQSNYRSRRVSCCPATMSICSISP